MPPHTGAVFRAPTGTVLLGQPIRAQAAVFAPGTTPLGFLTSNGVELTLGT